MKKAFIFIISFVLIVSLSSCNDIYEETTITDIKEYSTIWSLSERRTDETNILFPSSVDEEQCVDFICKHTTYFPLGTGWQVSLEMKYDDTLFLTEIDRLIRLCENSPICGSSEYFDKPAYATVWNWNGCFEYAFVNEKEKTVCYIYLQLVSGDDLIIDQGSVPKGYDEMRMDDSEGYSVYRE